MGFFGLFKKKDKKETTQVKEVKFADLETWLSQIKKEESEKVKSQLLNIRNEINTEKSNLDSNLKILEQAKIINPNIPDRAKQIMEGNRKNYLEKISALNNKISYPEEIGKIPELISSFDSNLNNLEKSVAKSHAIMVEFFHEKATKVLTNIKNIDKQIKETKKILESSKLSNIKKTEEKIKNYSKKISESNQKKELLKRAEKEVENFLEKTKQKEQEIKKIKEGTQYENLIEKVKQKDSLTRELGNANSRMSHSFSEIESALKKYENLSKNSLVKKYLENPIKSLSEDENLEIVKIIESTRKAIIMNEIVINEKKRSRLFNEISKINEGLFRNFLQNKRQLEKSLNDLSSEIKDSVLLNQLNELEKSLEIEKAELEREKNSLLKAKTKFEEINFQKIKEDLEREVKEKLGRAIQIVI